MDRLQAMRLFTRIVELGSFSRAAEQLGLPRASATQIIQQLEAHLGVRLVWLTSWDAIGPVLARMLNPRGT